MRLNIVLFATGAWLLQRQAELPDLRLAWLLLLAAPAALCGRCARLPVRAAARGLVALAALAAGFLWAGALAHSRLGDALAPEWEGRDIVVTGVVASLPQHYERSVRFELDVERVLTTGAAVPGRIVLAWWPRNEPGAGPRRPTIVAAGERWQLITRLKRPHGSVNPYGYDYEAALLERGVRATGYVRPGADNVRLAEFVHRPAYWVERARERLRTRVLGALPERPYAGIIAALAIGDQRAIPAPQWQTFTRTGVNHLMSIY